MCRSQQPVWMINQRQIAESLSLGHTAETNTLLFVSGARRPQVSVNMLTVACESGMGTCQLCISAIEKEWSWAAPWLALGSIRRGKRLLSESSRGETTRTEKIPRCFSHKNLCCCLCPEGDCLFCLQDCVPGIDDLSYSGDDSRPGTAVAYQGLDILRLIGFELRERQEADRKQGQACTSLPRLYLKRAVWAFEKSFQKLSFRWWLLLAQGSPPKKNGVQPQPQPRVHFWELDPLRWASRF